MIHVPLIYGPLLLLLWSVRILNIIDIGSLGAVGHSLQVLLGLWWRIVRQFLSQIEWVGRLL